MARIKISAKPMLYGLSLADYTFIIKGNLFFDRNFYQNPILKNLLYRINFTNFTKKLIV